jgi:hypothetical protein
MKKLTGICVLCAVLGLLLISCGGGDNIAGPSPAPVPAPAPTPSPAPPPAPIPSATITVSDTSGTTERTATGVTYHLALTVRETSGRSPATIASIRVNLSSATRSGGATFDSSQNIVTSLVAGGSQTYRLNITSDNATDLYNQVGFVITFSDSVGVQGTSSSSGTTAVTPPGSPSPTPAPAPAPGPAPAPSGKYDGTYDFFFKNPGPGGVTESHNLSRFLIIRNGNVTSSDGTLAGTVDGFGAVRFTGPCPINNSVGDWTGSMNASALVGSNFGQGQYTCRIAIGGGANNTWQANQSR